MAESVKAIRLAAMNLLARREHIFLELEQKLAKKYPESPQVPSVLQTLTDEGLQSDARFAEAFVRYRASKGFGPERIVQELKQRGIAHSLAANAIDEADVNWEAMLQHQFDKKTPGQKMLDAKERAKVQRFLSYRGFSPEAIRYLFN